MLTVSSPVFPGASGTKTLVVHGQNECDIPTQLPVHEDTQFEALLKVGTPPRVSRSPLTTDHHGYLHKMAHRGCGRLVHVPGIAMTRNRSSDSLVNDNNKL